MSGENNYSKASQMIYVQLDGHKFGRVPLSSSITIAQLRTVLVKDHKLQSNTHFLDNQDYPLAQENEKLETVEILLRADYTVLIETHQIIPEQQPRTYTSNSTRQGERIINEGTTFFFTELISVVRWIWCLILKPLVIIVLTLLLLYYGYTKVICDRARFLPIVAMYCPANELDLIPVPPVSTLADHSASLANTLMNADVNAPMRFVQAKSSLIHLRNQVIYSDIDIGVREKLSEQMGELQQLIQTGADQLTIMLASFGGTLDKLRIYTQFALDDLSKVINHGINMNNSPLQIGKVNYIPSV